MSMAKQQNIFLIGPMGSGKTSVGRYLAKTLNLNFYDSDQEIEKRTGADIPWIFDVEGEEGFRERESKIIDELTHLQGIVLATGGGVIHRAENRTGLAGRGVVIYLKASVAQQLERVGRSRNRPLLLDKNPETVLTQLLATREPLYLEIADLSYETNDESVRSIANKILKDLKQRNIV